MGEARSGKGGCVMDEAMSNHTPEPWTLKNVASDPFYDICGPYVPGEGSPSTLALAFSKADARRIVACVNACEGMETEFLESVHSLLTMTDKARNDMVPRSLYNALLAALEELVHQHETGFWSTWQTNAHFIEPLNAARAAIAKCKVGAQ